MTIPSNTAPDTAPAEGEGQRAVPYVCPFCGEETLRPAESGRWHCRSCLRLFSVAFHGLAQPSIVQPSFEQSQGSDLR
jgi:ribosomal protein L37AE/L43A